MADVKNIIKTEITPQTLVSDLLENYPELEEKLIEISPIFEKLKNPILRKTVSKVATLKQAATIGNVQVGFLINKLRESAGQDTVKMENEKPTKQSKPDWVNKSKVKFEYDANIDLENGIHPAGKVTKEIHNISGDELYLLLTPFVPAPLIQMVEEKGYEVYVDDIGNQKFETYIKSKS
jgi:effector-binding domain-containing protein